MNPYTVLVIAGVVSLSAAIFGDKIRFSGVSFVGPFPWPVRTGLVVTAACCFAVGFGVIKMPPEDRTARPGSDAPAPSSVSADDAASTSVPAPPPEDQGRSQTVNGCGNVTMSGSKVNGNVEAGCAP